MMLEPAKREAAGQRYIQRIELTAVGLSVEDMIRSWTTFSKLSSWPSADLKSVAFRVILSQAAEPVALRAAE